MKQNIYKILGKKKIRIIVIIILLIIGLYFIVTKTGLIENKLTDTLFGVKSATNNENCASIVKQYEQSIGEITDRLKGIPLSKEPNSMIEVGNTYIKNLELIRYNELKKVNCSTRGLKSVIMPTKL